MLRSGLITEINVADCTARVTFSDDGVVSDFLQIVVMGALSTKFFHIFDINEQVACLMDENSEEGVILGALYNKKTLPSGATKDKVRVLFSDESYIEYDRATHVYKIDVKGDVSIKAEGEVAIESETATITADTVEVDATTVTVDADSVTIDALMIDATGTFNLTGDAIVSGSVTAASISAPSFGGAGVTMSGGDIVATGDIEGANVKAGTVDLKLHVHPGVTTGPGSTGPPTP